MPMSCKIVGNIARGEDRGQPWNRGSSEEEGREFVSTGRSACAGWSRRSVLPEALHRQRRTVPGRVPPRHRRHGQERQEDQVEEVTHPNRKWYVHFILGTLSLALLFFLIKNNVYKINIENFDLLIEIIL